LLSAKIRQSIIGFVLGLLSIAIISPFLNSGHSIPDKIEFDSEVIQISKPQEVTEAQKTIDNISTDQIDKNAHLYPFFALHKVALNDDQVAAITQNKPRLSIVLNQAGQTRTMTAAILET